MLGLEFLGSGGGLGLVSAETRELEFRRIFSGVAVLRERGFTTSGARNRAGLLGLVLTLHDRVRAGSVRSTGVPAALFLSQTVARTSSPKRC